MEYITKKCPHCGKAYSIMQPKGTGFYGSPIRHCSKCGKDFIDKDYREIAIDGIRNVDTQKLSGDTIFACFGPTFMAIACVILYIGDRSLFSTGRSIWTLVLGAVSLGIVYFLVHDEIQGYAERQHFLKEESKRSKARLSNYYYACLLRDFGYPVPDQYLIPSAKDASVNETPVIPISEESKNQHNSQKTLQVDSKKQKGHIIKEESMTSLKSNNIVSPKYCYNCGKQLPPNSIFCSFCGAKIPKNPTLR